MTLEARIQTCRLIEQMKRNPTVFERMGVKDVSIVRIEERKGQNVRDYA